MQKKYSLKIVWMVAVMGFLAACGGEAAKENKSSATENQPSTTEKPTASKKYIIFFGNSLSAGYGVEPSEAFPALIQKRLDSLGMNYTVVNAGISGETTATGDSRVDWVISQQPVDVFVLELGANDGLRGVPVTETKKNLLSIIDKVRAAHPNAEIILAGMMIPPSMGAKYSKDFLEVFPFVANEKNVRLIPFLLKNVGGEDSLNQADGIHPNPEGHKLVTENVWDVLKDVVK